LYHTQPLLRTSPNMPESQGQYKPFEHVALIQSPLLRIPKPVQMPPDIHPLPDTLEPYMVYSFSLEERTLALLAQQRQSLSTDIAQHTEALAAWDREKQRRKREELRRVAPGFEPDLGMLVPTRK